MKKKVISALLSVAMVATLLVGCGQSAAPAAETPAAEEATEEATTNDTEEEATEEETATLTYNGKDYIVNKEAFEKWLAENGTLA